MVNDFHEMISLEHRNSQVNGGQAAYAGRRQGSS